MAVNRHRFCLLFLIAFAASCNAAAILSKLDGTTIPALKEVGFKSGDDALKPSETSRLRETTPTNRGLAAVRPRNGGGVYGIGTVATDVKHKTAPEYSRNPIVHARNSDGRSTTPRVIGTRSQVQRQQDRPTIIPTFGHKSIETSTENKEKSVTISHRSKGMTEDYKNAEPDVFSPDSLMVSRTKEITEGGQAPIMKPKKMSPVPMIHKSKDMSKNNHAGRIQTDSFNKDRVPIQDHKEVGKLLKSNTPSSLTHGIASHVHGPMHIPNNDENDFLTQETVFKTNPVSSEGDGQTSSETGPGGHNVMLSSFTVSSDSGCEGNCPTTISPIKDSHLPSTASGGASNVSYRSRNGKLDVDEILARVSMKMNITINDSDSQASILGSIVRKGNEGGFLIDKLRVGLNYMSKASKLEHQDINIDDKFIKLFEYDKDGRKKPFFPSAWMSSVLPLMAADGGMFLKKENL